MSFRGHNSAHNCTLHPGLLTTNSSLGPPLNPTSWRVSWEGTHFSRPCSNRRAPAPEPTVWGLSKALAGTPEVGSRNWKIGCQPGLIPSRTGHLYPGALAPWWEQDLHNAPWWAGAFESDGQWL